MQLVKNNFGSDFPFEAEIVERVQETPTIFTLKLRFTDEQIHKDFSFRPGQFNMVYLYGVGEIAVSIVSDPETDEFYDHTIRAVGRVTKGLSQLEKGDYLGIRGPYGRGWPLNESSGKDIVIITGGLGCAPVVSVIRYIIQRRDQFGKLSILQGIKHSDDMIFRKQYTKWKQMPETQIFIAADEAGQQWPFYTGRVTNFINQLTFDPDNALAMMCGPEGMMKTAAKALMSRNLTEENIYLSMERNMQCGVGRCGHCQYGGHFVCKDGPIFSYSEIKNLFDVAGF